jgi:NAD-dependent deacetylase
MECNTSYEKWQMCVQHVLGTLHTMTLETATQEIQNANSIAVLTGAGISKDSGIPTFRDAQTGYWAKYSPHELASPQAFAKDPELVWRWYLERFSTCQNAQPNAAHAALAKLETEKNLTLVTQNVDRLHQRAGSQNVLELHGNIVTARCERCSTETALEGQTGIPTCPNCGRRMRPNVVWFGEMLPRQTLEQAWTAFTHCDVALVIGTSAVVEPADKLGRVAKQAGAFLIEVNPEVTPLSKFADLRVSSGAVKGLSALLP